MNIVVVGGGKVGATLIEQLSNEEHDITVVDVNQKVLTNISNRYDIVTVCGNGAAYPIQIQAGVEKADLIIATTSMDERNILCCMVAGQVGAKYTIARVRNPEYASHMQYLQDNLKLSMSINPEQEAAREIMRILHFPAAIRVNQFMHDRVEMIEIRRAEGNPLIGLSLSEMKNRYDQNILICAVSRENKSYIPNGNFVLHQDDHITLLGSPADLNSLTKKLNPSIRKVKNVMIVGGSRIAHYLCEMLTSRGVKTKIIDCDENRCRELCEQLPDTRIIHGDARDRELLQEEGIERMDAFISLTGLDEENIIASMFASSCGVPKIISKISDRDMARMVDKLGLDIVISPKTLTADLILRFVRSIAYAGGSSVKTLYTISNGNIEVMEYLVDGALPFLGKPLADLPIRSGILIACVIRDGQPLIAGGSTTICLGDSVIIVAPKGRLKNLADIV